MSERRHAGILIILEADPHGDNAKATLAAIGRIKGVVSVERVMGDDELEMADRPGAAPSLAGPVARDSECVRSASVSGRRGPW